MGKQVRARQLYRRYADNLRDAMSDNRALLSARSAHRVAVARRQMERAIAVIAALDSQFTKLPAGRK